MSKLHRIAFVVLALGAPLAAGGCSGQVYTESTFTATATTPTLVSVQPDVWVVAHQDYPIFYSDGYYWRWTNDGWYRSSVYTRGWVSVRTTVVPVRVRHIERPRRYVHYRPTQRDRVRRGPPARVRDKRVHRDDRRDNRPDRVQARPGHDHDRDHRRYRN